MKAQLQALAARFDALARRERVLIAIAAIAAIVLLGYSLLIEPALDLARTDTRRSEQMHTDLANLSAQMAALDKGSDPDAANRQALAAVQAQWSQGDARLKSLQATMVPPEKMRAFVESLLARHPQVALVSLRTLPPAPVLDAKAADKDASPAGEEPNIYKHGIEIRIAGRYDDLLAYLVEVEHMPQRILWNKVTLSAEAYPRSVLTLTVYTLSLDEKWLTL
jgi:MSHA biogenesis protein MshJ